MSEHKADFLWPHEDGSIEEAGYEFANGATEGYRQTWWRILLDRREAAPEITEAMLGPLINACRGEGTSLNPDYDAIRHELAALLAAFEPRSLTK